jgi:hypothetical protein
MSYPWRLSDHYARYLNCARCSSSQMTAEQSSLCTSDRESTSSIWYDISPITPALAHSIHVHSIYSTIPSTLSCAVHNNHLPMIFSSTLPRLYRSHPGYWQYTSATGHVYVCRQSIFRLRQAMTSYWRPSIAGQNSWHNHVAYWSCCFWYPTADLLNVRFAITRRGAWYLYALAAYFSVYYTVYLSWWT